MLVNNAGIVTGKKILESSDELMVKTMEVNSISHFWVSHSDCVSLGLTLFYSAWNLIGKKLGGYKHLQKMDTNHASCSGASCSHVDVLEGE